MKKYIDEYLKKFEETGEVFDENSEIFRKINQWKIGFAAFPVELFHVVY